MNTLTKEWLQNTITGIESIIDDKSFVCSEIAFEIGVVNNILTAFKIALASLEADPVAYIFKHPAGKLFWALTDESNKEQADVIPVYAAAPASVVPDNASEPLAYAYKELTPEIMRNHLAVFERYGIAPNDSSTTIQALRIALDGIERSGAMLHGAEPVSQTYNLPDLIEGMEVSIDVSTCDADLGNRYFGTVTEALELDTAKNGYILLVQDAEPNFDVNGKSPVTPDGSDDG